jgi:hypothetical protein
VLVVVLVLDHLRAVGDEVSWLAAESASRLLIILVIMTMQFGKINAFNEMCAGLKS